MGEKQYPHIDLDYVLEGEAASASSIFALAGKKYAETRQDAEEVSILVQPREKLTQVSYGRKVLETLAYAEIARKGDEMRSDIEERIAQLGGGSLLDRSFVGSRLSGNLPDQE